VDPVSRRSRFDDAKRTAGKATLSRFREHLAQLAWLDGLGATAAWVAGVPAAKVSHLAAQARVTDAADMADLGVRKRAVSIACLIHTARIRGRDELATMFCKRMANIHKQARDRFERDRRRPSRLVRRHFEACVFSYLAAELRSGDIAVRGSESFANLHEQLLTWDGCRPLLADFCTEVGLPADVAGFTGTLRDWLTAVAAGVDAGYPDNADLVLDDAGVPVLKRRRGQARRASAIALEKTLLSRLPERSLLDVVTRAAYWTGWPRHFGRAPTPLPGTLEGVPAAYVTALTAASVLDADTHRPRLPAAPPTRRATLAGVPGTPPTLGAHLNRPPAPTSANAVTTMVMARRPGPSRQRRAVRGCATAVPGSA
jgi:hypothetical protein